MIINAVKINQPKIIVAILAMAALAAALLVTTMSVGAQDGDLPAGSGNTYADPQPCGPGANTAFQPEPHEITTGHFYLFDAYWQDTTEEQATNGNTGVLHTNMCPPELTTTTETDDDGNETIVTALTDSNIDVNEAIFHVLDKHKATVVDAGPDDTNTSHLDVNRYAEVGEYVDRGKQVWWLRLDDPNLAGDQTSDLTLGFSTERFDADHWARKDEQPAFRYMLEFQRTPGIDPHEHPHFLAYYPRYDGGPIGAQLVWDSAEVDTKFLPMAPGQLQDLEWVFTKPGTYAISVHVQGWVRERNPYETKDPNHGTWQRISPNGTETSEVRRYVIQVGDELAEVEPPRFGVSFVVSEDAAAGTVVGSPIQVFSEEAEGVTLAYTLSGEGSADFTLDSDTHPGKVSILVADGITLDLDRQATYDLTLGVSNNIDHESNPDPTVDDTLTVQITVEASDGQ